MRIAYCTNVRLPNERAHGRQVAQVCSALQGIGHEVHIFCPDRINPIKEDFWSYHHVDRTVDITHVESFDGIACPWTPSVLGLKLTTRSFSKNLLPLLVDGSFDCIYTRTPEMMSALQESDIPVIVELHKIPRLFRKKFVERCNDCALVIALTTPMKEELIRLEVLEEKIIVEGDAVDLSSFQQPVIRQKEDLFPHIGEKPVIAYAGSLMSMGMEKGVTELVDALFLLKERDMPFFGLIIGGPDSAVQQYQKRASRKGMSPDDVLFTGFLPAESIPEYLRTSDVLVYPAPGSDHPYYTRDTSPLKLFEYMAAGRPIVSADLPPIHDILDDETAIFCKPGSAESLADALEHAILYREDAKNKAEEAHRRVQAYTWDARMRRIVQEIKERISLSP